MLFSFLLIDGYPYIRTTHQVIFSVSLQAGQTEPVILCPAGEIIFHLLYREFIGHVMQVMYKVKNLFSAYRTTIFLHTQPPFEAVELNSLLLTALAGFDA